MSRSATQASYRIVGFEVEPQSISMEAMTTTAKEGKLMCALSSKGEPPSMEIKKDCKKEREREGGRKEEAKPILLPYKENKNAHHTKATQVQLFIISQTSAHLLP